jgi:hypothetical protein
MFATLPDGHFSADGRIFGLPALSFPGGIHYYIDLTEPD